jgi:hypothetical protein
MLGLKTSRYRHCECGSEAAGAVTVTVEDSPLEHISMPYFPCLLPLPYAELSFIR